MGGVTTEFGREADISRAVEAVLVRQCAPTLAGMKPGSLFCLRHAAPEDSRQRVCQWEGRLAPRGISLRILLERPAAGSALVYMYRRGPLEQTLSAAACRRFLAEAGYSGADLDGLLRELARRLETRPEFPHEIGLFLGYPLGDVVGFIENRGRNFTCRGLWKSYGDPAEAQARFARYRGCTRAYVRLHEQGVPIEKLAVPL